MYRDCGTHAEPCQLRVNRCLRHAQRVDGNDGVARRKARRLCAAAVEHVGEIHAIRCRCGARAKRWRGAGYDLKIKARLMQQGLQRQFTGAINRVAKKGGERAAQVRAAGVERCLLHAAFRYTRVKRTVLLPEPAHHVIQRGASARSRPQQQVEAQRHQRTLGVVTDDGIGRVFILPVKLDPRIETRIAHRLFQAAGTAQYRADRLGKCVEIFGWRDQPGPQQHQIIVVGRDALERPQLARVVFARQVIGREGSGADALDVPRMKIFVAAQPEKGAVALAGFSQTCMRQIVARTNERSRSAVLQPAIPVAHCERQKQVTLKRHIAPRRARAVKQTNLRLTYTLQICGQPHHVAVVLPGDRNRMQHAAGGKLDQRKRTQLDRVVDQFIVTRRLVAPEVIGHRATGARQGSCNAPAPIPAPGRTHDVHIMAHVFLAGHAQEHTAAVKECMRLVQMCRSHR